MENSKNLGNDYSYFVTTTLCPLCDTVGLFVTYTNGVGLYMNCCNCHYSYFMPELAQEEVISTNENIKADNSKS